MKKNWENPLSSMTWGNVIILTQSTLFFSVAILVLCGPFFFFCSHITAQAMSHTCSMLFHAYLLVSLYQGRYTIAEHSHVLFTTAQCSDIELQSVHQLS